MAGPPAWLRRARRAEPCDVARRIGSSARAVARARPQGCRGSAGGAPAAATFAGAASTVAARAALLRDAAGRCRSRPFSRPPSRGALSLWPRTRHGGPARRRRIRHAAHSRAAGATGYRPRPQGERLPDDCRAGRARLGVARTPEGRNSIARRLLRCNRQRHKGRRPRRRPCPRGRHRCRAAAGRACRHQQRQQAQPANPQARPVARLSFPGADGPGRRDAGVRQGRAGAARGHRR